MAQLGYDGLPPTAGSKRAQMRRYALLGGRVGCVDLGECYALSAELVDESVQFAVG
jgi:hypothetical protein